MARDPVLRWVQTDERQQLWRAGHALEPLEGWRLMCSTLEGSGHSDAGDSDAIVELTASETQADRFVYIVAPDTVAISPGETLVITGQSSGATQPIACSPGEKRLC